MTTQNSNNHDLLSVSRTSQELAAWLYSHSFAFEPDPVPVSRWRRLSLALALSLACNAAVLWFFEQQAARVLAARPAAERAPLIVTLSVGESSRALAPEPAEADPASTQPVADEPVPAEAERNPPPPPQEPRQDPPTQAQVRNAPSGRQLLAEPSYLSQEQLAGPAAEPPDGRIFNPKLRQQLREARSRPARQPPPNLNTSTAADAQELVSDGDNCFRLESVPGGDLEERCFTERPAWALRPNRIGSCRASGGRSLDHSCDGARWQRSPLSQYDGFGSHYP